MDEIPAQVRLFLEERIHSVAQLELLLLLKNDPGKAWAAAEASRALAVPVEMAAAHLSELQGAGLLASSGGHEAAFHYGPQSTELSQLVESLATIYQERRVSLITLIYSRPVDKVRTFADAFRFRKD